jgi:hypothetical protein
MQNNRSYPSAPRPGSLEYETGFIRTNMGRCT